MYMWHPVFSINYNLVFRPTTHDLKFLRLLAISLTKTFRFKLKISSKRSKWLLDSFELQQLASSTIADSITHKISFLLLFLKFVWHLTETWQNYTCRRYAGNYWHLRITCEDWIDTCTRCLLHVIVHVSCKCFTWYVIKIYLVDIYILTGDSYSTMPL